MKILILAALIMIPSAVPALAQGPGSYRIDNFDLANGVHIQLPEAPPTRSRKSLRRLTKVSNLNYSGVMPALTQLTSLTPGDSLKGFTTGNSQVDGFIVESGRRNAVDPLLLYSIMHQESTFKQGAISPKGARGLMQLMPRTALRFGVASIFDPRQNIEGGARYMRFLLDQFDGNIQLALAGYNAGEGAVMKYGNRIPPYAETQEYVRRISRRYSLIRDPLTAGIANTLTRDQIASARKKESTPLTIYERSVFAVKLPDGRLQLVSK